MNTLEEGGIESGLDGVRCQIRRRWNELHTHRALSIDSVASDTGIDIDFPSRHRIARLRRDIQILQASAAGKPESCDPDQQTGNDDCASHSPRPPLMSLWGTLRVMCHGHVAARRERNINGTSRLEAVNVLYGERTNERWRERPQPVNDH